MSNFKGSLSPGCFWVKIWMRHHWQSSLNLPLSHQDHYLLFFKYVRADLKLNKKSCWTQLIWIYTYTYFLQISWKIIIIWTFPTTHVSYNSFQYIWQLAVHSSSSISWQWVTPRRTIFIDVKFYLVHLRCLRKAKHYLGEK